MKKLSAIANVAIGAILVLACVGYQGSPPSAFMIRAPSGEEERLMTECGTSIERKRQFDQAARDAEPDILPKRVAAEEQVKRSCDDYSDARIQRVLGALYSEPRDAVWAEPMEQRLRPRLVKQLKDSVEILEISCRTTICWIRARGTTASSRAVFYNALEAVVEQPWTGLRFKGAGLRDSHGDEWTQEYIVTREPESQAMP